MKKEFKVISQIIQNNKRVLDIGCGEGRHSIALFVDNYAHTVGIDLSLKDLKIAKKFLIPRKSIKMNLTQLNYNE